VGKRAAWYVQRVGLAVQGARGAARRTGGLLAEGLGLEFEQGGQGAFGQAGGGRARQLFPGLEVGVEARTVVPKGAAGDDFPPGRREVTDFLEQIRG
jgi:hypothetical protein